MNNLVFKMLNPIKKYDEQMWTAFSMGDISKLQEFITSGVAAYSKAPILAKLVEKKRFDLAMLAIQNGVALDISDKGRTPLYHAAKYEHGELTLLLIDKGVNLSFDDEMKSNALMELADAEVGADPVYLVRIANKLIEKGVNVNATEEGGWTALHFAATHRHIELINTLIKAGADVKARNTAMNFAPIQHTIGAKSHCEQNYRVFLENGGLGGVVFDKNNEYHIENYLKAILEGYTELVQKYLSLGADPNQVKTERGGFGEYNTALILAVYGDTPEIVDALLQKGADVNATNKNGKTALDVAKKAGEGFYAMSISKDEKTALDGATKSMTNQTIIDLLVKAGARE